MKTKIIIVCGGPSSEHDVSLMSTDSILEHIDRDKYDLSLLYITRDKKVTLLSAGNFSPIPKNATYLSFDEGVEKYLKSSDLVFLSALHGEFGEDGTIQKILEENHIPYTGSSSEISKLVMNKEKTAEKLKDIFDLSFPNNIATSQFNNLSDLSFPLFCKPNNLGSSVGAKIVHSAEELATYVKEFEEKYPHTTLLIQEYIKGLEISVGCLEKKSGEFVSLPPIEIIPQHSEYFDYDSKYIAGESLEITPPTHMSKKLSDKLSDLAVEIHKTLGCKLYSRSDFIIKDEKIYFLETNTLPGMTANSLLPKEAAAIGMNFTQLLDFLISNSL